MGLDILVCARFKTSAKTLYSIVVNRARAGKLNWTKNHCAFKGGGL